MDDKLFQLDGPLYWNDLRPVSLWFFEAEQNEREVCLRGHRGVQYIGRGSVLNMVQQWNEFISK